MGNVRFGSVGCFWLAAVAEVSWKMFLLGDVGGGWTVMRSVVQGGWERSFIEVLTPHVVKN